ncbi:MAG: hypothetical protein MK081_16125, partial [Flavobacteriales bacterium]|nr:hypothetical protein [Flavobacteriales bacterium]
MKSFWSICVIVVVQVVATNIYAQCDNQSQVISFSSSIEHVLSSAIAEDGGYSFAGSITQGSETGYVLYKLDSNLSITDSKRIRSPLNDSGRPLVHTKLLNGNYVIAGYSQVGSQRHLKIVCFDETTVVWSKRLTGDFESPRAIHPLENGGVLLVGTSSTDTNGSDDAFAIEFDQSGNVAWKKGFGSSNNEHFYGASSSFDGLHLVVGNNQTYSGTHRPISATIDNNGVLVEYNVYTGAGLALFTTLAKHEGVYFCGGYVQLGNRTGIVVALDESFGVIWSKRVDMEGVNSNYVSGVGVDQNGDLFVSALAEGGNSRLHYLKIDPITGDLIENKTTTTDISANEVNTIGGYQVKSTTLGMLSVSNSIQSDGFVVVQSNECLSNSDCLIDADVNLLDYNLSRLSYDPDDSALQAVIDIDEFEVSDAPIPVADPCNLICLGNLD